MERYAQQQIRDSLEYQLNPTLGEQKAQAALRCCYGEDRESVSTILNQAHVHAVKGKKGLNNG
jgi:hypothetical protein